MPRKITTIRESLYWSYANLALAEAALQENEKKYSRKHYGIRARLYAGLCKGTMNVRSLVRDDQLKLTMPQACSYCGGGENLSMDHLFPRERGGRESGDNIVWACRSCNSSKGATDFLDWMRKNDRFPPMLLLRRYLKLAIAFCESKDIMHHPIEDAVSLPYELPFNLHAIPHSFPPLDQLVRWVEPHSMHSGN